MVVNSVLELLELVVRPRVLLLEEVVRRKLLEETLEEELELEELESKTILDSEDQLLDDVVLFLAVEELD
jgi:hypothetical protein